LYSKTDLPLIKTGLAGVDPEAHYSGHDNSGGYFLIVPPYPAY
jgi:hypothetical protein